MNYWSPQQFKNARLDLGMTRTQLADALECGLRTVERCEAEGCRKRRALAMERLRDGGIVMTIWGAEIPVTIVDRRLAELEG
jgi:DNA-binding XRE family transcriptional regulator